MRTSFAVLLLFCTSFFSLVAESNEHWFEVRSTHFVVLTDSNERQARRVASQFEQMRLVFHTLVPNATGDSGAPIIVLALKDRKGFQALEPAAYLGKGQLELAGLFLRTQDKNFILARLDSEDVYRFATIYHEYTHLMMSKAVWMPLWMNEGLAEFYQNTDIQDKDVLLGRPSEDNILYLRVHPLIPLTTLLKVDYSSPYYHDEQKGSVFYAESWALMHYIEITDAEKNTNRLRDYAMHLIQGEDSVTAAQHAFGDLQRLEMALRAYVQQMNFQAFKMRTTVTADVSNFTVRSVPLSEVNAVRADVMVNDGRTKEAEELLASSLHDDPNGAAAHETMGELRFRAGDIAGAKKWYGEAVKLDSQSYLAHYYFAAMSLQENDRAHDAEIEASLQTAIKLKPDFAPPYDVLAHFYASRHEKLDEAHRLNVQAVALDPGNIAYRMNAANVLMEKDDYISALGVLQVALKVAKTPEENAQLQMNIEQIEQYRNAVEQNRQQAAEVAQRVKSQQSAQAEVPSTDTGAKVLVFKQFKGKMVGVESTVAAQKYPEGEAKGAKRKIRGTIRNVECSYPSVIAFQIDGGAGKTVLLYNNNFYKITFTTANYTPEGDIKPCTDIEGLKAEVGYAEVTDPRVAGQALSIELSK